MKFILTVVLAFLMSCNTQTTKNNGKALQNNQRQQKEYSSQDKLTGIWVRKDYIAAVKNFSPMYQANAKFGKSVELQIKSGDTPDTLTAELTNIYGMMPYTLQVYHQDQNKYQAVFLGLVPKKLGHIQQQKQEILFTDGERKIRYTKISDSTSVFRDGVNKIGHQVLTGTYQVQSKESNPFKVTLSPNGKVTGFENYTNYLWYASDNAELDLLLLSRENEMKYFAIEAAKQKITLYHLQDGFPGESIITVVPKKQGLAYTLTPQ